MTMLDRIRERKIGQWALAYLAGSWVLLEVAQMVGDAFAWPDAVQRSLIALVAIGFVTTLVLAWYHGEQGRQHVSGPELMILASLLLVAGVALTWINSGSGAGEPPSAELDDRVATPGSPADDAVAMATAPILPRETGAAAPSVAVLPFENLSADPDHAYFALAVSDEITHALQQLGNLRVINRASASRYADADVSLREIGAALGVARVLAGSVQRQGDDVRIVAQLVDAGTESQIWSDRYSRRMDDAFQVQAEIAEQIARSLAGEFDPSQARRIMAGGTESGAAFELYGRAREVWFRDDWGPETLRRAIGLMRAAVDIDPDFARARADLSSMYSDLAGFEGPAVADSALAIAEEAAQLAPEMGDGQGALCYALDNLGRHEEALVACGRAVEMAPNSSDAAWNLGGVLASVGRLDEALPWYEKAAQSAPELPGLLGNIALMWQGMGDFARAEAWAAERRRQDPDDVLSEHVFFNIYWDSGDLDSARTALDRMVAVDPNHWLVAWARARFHMVAGEWAQAIPELLAYHEVENPDWNPPMHLAMAYQMNSDQLGADTLVSNVTAIAERYSPVATKVSGSNGPTLRSPPCRATPIRRSATSNPPWIEGSVVPTPSSVEPIAASSWTARLSSAH